MERSLTNIEAFLRQDRIALVGASHDPKSFSRAVMRELLEVGYDVVPVNPKGGTIEGRTVYERLADIPEPVGGALVLVSAATSEAVVREAGAAGIPRVWLHRGGGPGSSSPEAVQAANELGLTLVDGECPLMFVGRSKVHKMHGAMRRLGGRHPRSGPAPRLPAPVIGALALVQILVGLAALTSGVLLVAEPSGAHLGFEAAMLGPSPFGSFLVPGLVLATIVGIGHLVGFSHTVRRRLTVARAAVLLGAALIVWIVAQLLWLDAASPLQPAMLVVGLVEIVLGALAHRHSWPRPTFSIRVSPGDGPPLATPPA